MSVDEDFRSRFQAAKTHIERIQICIREQRYKIWQRADKPNLGAEEYLVAILGLPPSHPCVCRPRKSGGAGAKFVIEFTYTVRAFGAVMKLYFKGYFADDWTLKLEVQSLRDDEKR